MQIARHWDCARFVMTRRLTVSSYPVDMLKLVKNVAQESKTLDNLVHTVEKECPQHTVSICEYYSLLYDM